ncbi:MAG: outer membrane protein transport protein [Candidatus Marinimicrobia bacterium]|nr:outer membrane protein transport protein [Candidatus Neomarinimicrobiota bacterium]
MAGQPDNLRRRIRWVGWALLLFTASLIGQDDTDAVRPFLGVGGPGSRANGLGQAFTAVADDVTALHYNPAGLAHLIKTEFNLGYDHLSAASDVQGPNGSSTASITATRLTNLGLALPIPNTKLTLAFGYHRVRAFDRRQELAITNGEISTSEQFTTEGSLAAYSLGIGFQVSPQFALGGAIDLLRGQSDYTAWFTTLTGSVTDSSQYVQIEPDYRGVGLSLGLLFAPLPVWHVGLLLRTPQRIEVEETYTDETFNGKTTIDYQTRSSYTLRIGSSLSLGPALISGDLFWVDYSQVRFKSDLFDSTALIEDIDIPINDALRTNYTSTLGFALGTEILLPRVNIKLRGGFRHEPSYLKAVDPSTARSTVAFGISIMPVPQLKLDATYAVTSWKQDLTRTLFTGAGITATDRSTASILMVNLIYRL